MKSLKIIFIGIFSLGLISSLGAQTYRSFMRKANTQFDIHDYAGAAENYEKAAQKRRKNLEALSRQAECYWHLNKMEDAAIIFANVANKEDVEKKYTLIYGHILKSLGRYDEAKQWYLSYARDVDAVVGNHFAESCDFAKSQFGISSSYSVTNEFINTSASDFAPAFFGQQQVVYASTRSDVYRSSNTFTGKAKNQLFIASIGESKFLEAPVFLKQSDDNAYNEGPLSFSPDGKEVVYTKNNFIEGVRQIPSSGIEMATFFSEIGPSGEWINKQPFKYNGLGYSTGYASFSPTGDAIYFASDRPDGFGGFDIYVSFKAGNGWSTPQNLGPIVNSPGDEISPFFDGSMLFFSSNWHNGLGGFDVFRAEQLGDRWNRIFHLGNTVNSTYDDYGFIYDSFRNIGYLTSNRLNGRGMEDIYRVARSADYVVIRVINAADGTPIPNAIVDFSDCGEASFYTDENGVYSFQAIEGLNCQLAISKEGFMEGTIDISTLGLNQQKEYEVAISSQADAYAGKVFNYKDKTAVSGVSVFVDNLTTGSSTRVMTDDNGDYYVALSPFSNYNIRMSKAGFQDMNFAVKTEDGFDRSILGATFFIPSDVQGPYVPDEPTKPDDSFINSGYAVQLAVISKPAVDQFASLEDIGNVYAKEVNGKYKIRLGTYDTKDEARAALNTAKKRGVKGAFIVVEDGGAAAGGNDTSATPSNPTSSGDYKIQLGAFRSTKWFDPSKIEDMGYIEDRKKGDLTVKYLSGFNTLEEARMALPDVKDAGFKGAFIVVDDGGDLKKVK